MVIPAPTVPVAIVFAPGAVFVVETKYSYPFAGIDVDVARVLLEGGADPDAEDDGGDSPRSIVLERASQGL